MLLSRKDRLLQVSSCPKYLFTDINPKGTTAYTQHTGFLTARSPSCSGTEGKLSVISIPEIGRLPQQRQC